MSVIACLSVAGAWNSLPRIVYHLSRNIHTRFVQICQKSMLLRWCKHSLACHICDRMSWWFSFQRWNVPWDSNPASGRWVPVLALLQIAPGIGGANSWLARMKLVEICRIRTCGDRLRLVTTGLIKVGQHFNRLKPLSQDLHGSAPPSRTEQYQIMGLVRYPDLSCAV